MHLSIKIFIEFKKHFASHNLDYLDDNTLIRFLIARE